MEKSVLQKLGDKCTYAGIPMEKISEMGFWKVAKEPITCLIEPSGEITVYECSKCGARFYEMNAEEFNFCPNCRNPKREFFPNNLRSDVEED